VEPTETLSPQTSQKQPQPQSGGIHHAVDATEPFWYTLEQLLTCTRAMESTGPQPWTLPVPVRNPDSLHLRLESAIPARKSRAPRTASWGVESRTR
jgi:hypothetical protein